MGIRHLFGKRPSAAEQFEAELRSWGRDVWPERQRRDDQAGQYLEESLHRLRSTLGSEAMQEAAVELVFDPDGWVTRYHAHDDLKHTIVLVALATLAADPPVDLPKRVGDRVEYLRQNMDRAVQLPHHLPEFPPLRVMIGDLPPRLDQLLDLLERAAPRDQVAIDVVTDLALRGCGGMSRSARFVPRYVLFLHRAGALSDELFEQIAYANPLHGALLAPSHPRRWLKSNDWPDHQSARLTARLTALPVLTDAEGSLLARSEPTRGHLLDAVRLHAAHDLGSFDTARDYRHTPQQGAVLTLASTGPGDRTDLVEQLRRSPTQTLEAFLPVAPGSLRPLAAALGYEAAVELMELLHTLPEIEASADPEVGAVDIAAVRRAIAGAGPALAGIVFRIFKQAKFRPNLIKLLQAADGEHGEWIRNSLPKRNQLAVRAMAAAPLEPGFDEVRARYDWIEQFRAESTKFGSQRQGSERGAAAAALFNLATNAGYRDVTRLEVALAASTPVPVPSWTIGDYSVTIALHGARASTLFRSGDRTIKTAPKAVKQSADYKDIKATRLRMQTEAGRFSRMFERTMVLGEPFSAEEVGSLRRIPVAAAVLEGLVALDSSGTTARLTADGFTDVGGNLIDLDGGLTVPHPIVLDQRNELTLWQRRLVFDKVVQPFQQAFRAHYPLTPVELEDGLVSGRFAGHVVDTGRASALFGTRDWVPPEDEGGEVSKRFAGLNLTAVWELTDVGHYLTERASAGTGGIFFVEGTRWYGTDRLPLEQVPAGVFSDVMRDADLVVSVAPGDPGGQGRYRGTGEGFSPESLAVRRQLVEALVADLEIPGVTFDESSAFVTGRLASYRIHLGTGAIYVGQARHLCVVPEGWRGRKDLFLPFVDDADERVSLIISKILMFSADHQIKDQTILAQIDKFRSG